MNLLNLMQNRRSVRRYTGEPIAEADLERVLQAGLLSASGRAIRPWAFIVVQNKDTLRALADCRASGSAAMLAEAACAIVVVGDADKTDVWVEDCSIAMANMHLMADALGLGSCWIQGRLREAPNGGSTEDSVRELLHIPANYRLEAILSLGMPQAHPAPHRLDDLPTDRIHREVF